MLKMFLMVVVVSFIVVALVELQGTLGTTKPNAVPSPSAEIKATEKPAVTKPTPTPELVEVTIKVNTHHTYLLDEDHVFLAGDITNWKPNKLMFEKIGTNEYAVTFSAPKNKNFEYKLTLGSWETSEIDAEGNPVNNRKLIPSFNEQTEVLYVDGWGNR